MVLIIMVNLDFFCFEFIIDVWYYFLLIYNEVLYLYFLWLISYIVGFGYEIMYNFV